MLLKHFILTRFSYRGKNALKHMEGPTWKTSDDPLGPERLELRFKLFEATCLPSVKAQTNQTFSWIIIVDENLQPQYRSRLESLLKGQNKCILHTYNAEDNLDQLDWLNPYFDITPNYVLTTNLDDDDALPNNFVSEAREYFSSRFQSGNLPPIVTLGIREIIQWDMITSRGAPLGWRSPWHRKRRTSSCGFSLLAKYPELPFCALGLKHSHAEHYLNFSSPPNNRHIELCRAAFTAAAVDNELRLDDFPPDKMFHNLGAKTGPVLMSNHVGNDQKWRLYERKSGKTPVTGPETFPNLTVDLRRFAEYADDFEKNLKDHFMSALGSILKTRKHGK